MVPFETWTAHVPLTFVQLKVNSTGIWNGFESFSG
jgi:hypothetical protein